MRSAARYSGSNAPPPAAAAAPRGRAQEAAVADRDSGPRRQVLSEALKQAIDGRRVAAAVFTSYTFDPGFFERQLLPLLFDRAFSRQDMVRLMQLEDSLRGLERLAVYYDRRALEPTHGSARLDYQRIGLAPAGRVLHAKNALLLVEDRDPETGATRPSLLVLTTSANLTEAGWWRNLETAHIAEIAAGQRSSLRGDLLSRGRALGLIDRLLHADRAGAGGADHGALEAVRRFLKNETYDRLQASHGSQLHPRLYTGRERFPDFLRRTLNVGPGGYRLEVVAPFLDQTDDARTLRRLIDTLQPEATRILLPRRADGKAACSEAHYDAVEDMPGVRWAALPAGLLRLSADHRNAAERFVHAKVYRLFSPQGRWQVLVSGSVNLTAAAHGGARRGNLESAVLVDQANLPVAPRWWLQPDERVRPAFDPLQPPEALDRTAAGDLLLRYDWAGARADYRWLPPAGKPAPGRIEVHGGGRLLCALAPPRAGRWRPLAQRAAAALGRHLRSSSLVELHRPGAEPLVLLVREAGMAHKPSLLHELSPEQILEYWSLLSDEQRDHFLAGQLERQLAAAAGQDPGLVQLEPGGSMFDRFAGIFHAFSCLEEHVADALEAEPPRRREAEYRLLGRKFDSLPSLVDKVVKDPKQDPVQRYLHLLCARELLDRLQAAHPAFFTAHARRLGALREQLAAVADVKAALDLGPGIDRERFFRWFEQTFGQPMPLPGEVEP